MRQSLIKVKLCPNAKRQFFFQFRGKCAALVVAHPGLAGLHASQLFASNSRSRSQGGRSLNLANLAPTRPPRAPWLPPGAGGLLPGRGASVTSTQGRERQVNLIQGVFNPRQFLYPASDKLALCEWQMSHFLTDWSPRCVRLLQATRPQCSSDVYYCAVQNFSPSLSFSLMDVTEVLNTLTARPLLPENDEVCTLTNCFLRKIKYLSQV